MSPAVDSGDANAIVTAFNMLPTTAKGAGTVIENSMASLYANGVGTQKVGKGFYGVVYLFYSPTQYTEWADANNVLGVTPGSANADTASDPTTFQAYYTAIWKMPATGYNNGDGTNGLQTLTALMMHEFGHWADYLYKGLNTEDKNALALSGTAGVFSKEYTQDLKALDATAVYPCTPKNMNGGVFAGRADAYVLVKSTNAPYFICNGYNVFGQVINGTTSTGNGPGLNKSSNTNVHPDYSTQTTNGAVLQAAWPTFFKPGFVTTKVPYAELWAEAFAASIGSGVNYNSLSANYDAYFGTINNWSGLFCTAKFAQYVATNGALPTSASNYYAVNGVANPNNCPFN
jgi:hypothetical protein